MRGVRTSDALRVEAVRLREHGHKLRESARRVGLHWNTVRNIWIEDDRQRRNEARRLARMKKQSSSRASVYKATSVSHDPKAPNPGFYFEETTRKKLTTWLREWSDVSEEYIAMLVKEADCEMRFAGDMRRKQTREHTMYPRREDRKPRYQHSNRQARNEIRYRLWWIHDLLPEVDSADIGRAEFADIVLRDGTLRSDLGLPKLNPEKLQTSAEPLGLRETPTKPDEVAVNVRRALLSGERDPFVQQRIYKRIKEGARESFGSASPVAPTSEERLKDEPPDPPLDPEEVAMDELIPHALEQGWFRTERGWFTFDKGWFSFEPGWHWFEQRRYIQKAIIKERMPEAVQKRISEIEEEARRKEEDFRERAETFTKENAPLRVEIPARATGARTIERYCHEHPDGVRLKELYRKHFFTLAETAQKDRRLREELAALGVSLD